MKEISLNKKIYTICGILAPILYLITVIIGGLLRPGYSHTSQAISELVEFQAPNKAFLDSLFLVYNIFMVIFGYGMFKNVKIKGRSGIQIGTASLILLGILGLIMTMFFPMDPMNAEATFAGTMHMVLAGFMSLLSILTILFVGQGFKNDPQFSVIRTYSFVTALIVIVSGGVAVSGGPYLGVYERITIGVFLQWIFFVALKLFSRQNNQTMA